MFQKLDNMLQQQSSQIKEAVQELQKGNLVAFPTETVYGLGADANNIKALHKIFELKGRPKNHPLIVHLAKHEEIEQWCKELPQAAIVLAKLFWPGPLTLILKKAARVNDLLTGGQDTIALRIPSHPLALSLLSEFGSGIAAPSANKFGKISPTCAEDVRNEFKQDELFILDGGNCTVGLESTIVDLSSKFARILRPGMIQSESIALTLKELDMELVNPFNTFTTDIDTSNKANPSQTNIPRVPGSLDRHYAPQTKIKLVESDDLINILNKSLELNEQITVLSFQAPNNFFQNNRNINKWLIGSSSPTHYAYSLYRNIRQLDELNSCLIIIEKPPKSLSWEAINDRLKRAAAESQPEGECDGS